MIKKILTMTSIAVLATFIMTIAMTNVAQADDHIKTEDFKCDKSFGSFFNAAPGDPNFTGSWADCTGIGQAGLASALVSDGTIDGDGCLTLVSVHDSFLVNEKGFITFDTSGTQCFNNVDGDPLTVGGTWDGTFCGSSGSPSTSAYTSELEGTYTITGGLVDGKRYVGGEGTTSSFAEHCAMDSAPFGNSGTTTLEGTAELFDES